jgi:hypothetical protein
MNLYFLSLLQPTRSRRKSGCVFSCPKIYSEYIFFSGRLIIQDKPNYGDTHLYVYTVVRKRPIIRIELGIGPLRLWVICPTIQPHFKAFINVILQKQFNFRGLNLILRLDDRVIDNILKM